MSQLRGKPPNCEQAAHGGASEPFTWQERADAQNAQPGCWLQPVASSSKQTGQGAEFRRHSSAELHSTQRASASHSVRLVMVLGHGSHALGKKPSASSQPRVRSHQRQWPWLTHNSAGSELHTASVVGVVVAVVVGVDVGVLVGVLVAVLVDDVGDVVAGVAGVELVVEADDAVAVVVVVVVVVVAVVVGESCVVVVDVVVVLSGAVVVVDVP